MYKGIDLVWALQYVLTEERREANDKRNALLRQVVTENFRLDAVNDAALVARGVLVLQRLRTFNDGDMQDTLYRLCEAFPMLAELNHKDSNQARQLVVSVVRQIKDVSKTTFGVRTGISVSLAVLRTAEPNYLEDNLRHFLEEDRAALANSAQQVREFVVAGQSDLIRWMDLAFANFIAFEEAEDRARFNKPRFPGMGTGMRTYERNWFNLSKDPEFFTNCWNALGNGAAQRFAEDKALVDERRRSRRTTTLLPRRFQAPRQEEPGLDQAAGNRTPEASLGVHISDTNSDKPVQAERIWQSVPSNIGEVRSWIAGILDIWGGAELGGSITVNCGLRSASSRVKLSFTASDASDAGKKIAKFIEASSL